MRSDKYGRHNNKSVPRSSTGSRNRNSISKARSIDSKNKKEIKKFDTIHEDFLSEYKKSRKDSVENKSVEPVRTERHRQERSDIKQSDIRSENVYNKDLKKASKREIKKMERHQKKLDRKKKKENKKKSSLLSKVIKVLIMLFLMLAVCMAGAYYFLNSQISKMSYVETSLEEFAIDDQVDKSLENYRNIAVLGIDAREGERSSDTRTDAIIIASINKSTGDVSLVSVMRDSYLLMENSNNETFLDKATHAHVYGGPVNTCRMLNKSLDLNISEFVVMDWSAVADTVDALGGITVNVQENELWDLNHWGPETAENTGRTWTQITNTGEQRIDGVQAATYCRIRKNSGGDNARTERMKKVILAILNEVKSNPSKITQVADKVLPEVTTNMGTNAIASLLPQVVDFNISKNYGYPSDYYGGLLEGVWYAVPTTLEENAQNLYKSIFPDVEYAYTSRLKEISQKIINETGISEGTEIN